MGLFIVLYNISIHNLVYQTSVETATIYYICDYVLASYSYCGVQCDKSLLRWKNNKLRRSIIFKLDGTPAVSLLLAL